MRRALAIACHVRNDVPVAALIVKDGELIASAVNRREEDNSPTAHAELLAIQAAAGALESRRLTGCTLYVTLEPCPMCAGAMILAGLERCVFGAFDKAYGCCGSLYALPYDERFSHRVAITGGVLEAEAQGLLQGFFRAQRDAR